MNWYHAAPATAVCPRDHHGQPSVFAQSSIHPQPTTELVPINHSSQMSSTNSGSPPYDPDFPDDYLFPSGSEKVARSPPDDVSVVGTCERLFGVGHCRHMHDATAAQHHMRMTVVLSLQHCSAVRAYACTVCADPAGLPTR